MTFAWRIPLLLFDIGKLPVTRELTLSTNTSIPFGRKFNKGGYVLSTVLTSLDGLQNLKHLYVEGSVFSIHFSLEGASSHKLEENMESKAMAQNLYFSLVTIS